MKGTYLFVVFFLIFTSTMLLIPVPMFPGDTMLSLAKIATSQYTAYLSALINGIVYGLIAWAIFMITMRKIENTNSKHSVRSNSKKRRTR